MIPRILLFFSNKREIIRKFHTDSCGVSGWRICRTLPHGIKRGMLRFRGARRSRSLRRAGSRASTCRFGFHRDTPFPRPICEFISGWKVVLNHYTSKRFVEIFISFEEQVQCSRLPSLSILPIPLWLYHISFGRWNNVIGAVQWKNERVIVVIGIGNNSKILIVGSITGKPPGS